MKFSEMNFSIFTLTISNIFNFLFSHFNALRTFIRSYFGTNDEMVLILAFYELIYYFSFIGNFQFSFTLASNWILIIFCVTARLLIIPFIVNLLFL